MYNSHKISVITTNYLVISHPLKKGINNCGKIAFNRTISESEFAINKLILIHDLYYFMNTIFFFDQIPIHEDHEILVISENVENFNNCFWEK